MSASKARQPTLVKVAPRFLVADMEQALAFYGQLGFATPDLDPLVGGRRREICYTIARRVKMGRTQPAYTKEFKQQAVHLFETSGKPKTQIARELGISDSALSKWCKEFGEQGEEAFPGKGHQAPLEEEIRHLRRENEVLRQEREILKKAMSIFAQPRA